MSLKKDYKSCIYQISHKDSKLGLVYVGSTRMNLSVRLNIHRFYAKNYEKDNCILYKKMKELGIYNFTIKPLVKFYIPLSSVELRKKEREIYDALKPSLNVNRPYISETERKELRKACHKNYRERNKDKFKCVYCDYNTFSKNSMIVHNNSAKHIMKMEKTHQTYF